MQLSPDLWERFSTYLFVDRKLSTSSGSKDSIKSRFGILVKHFGDKEFTRDNFNAFIQEKQEKGYKATYINGFIKVGKHLDRFLGTNQIEDYTYFTEERGKWVDILTKEEIESLANTSLVYTRDTDRLNRRYKALIYFLAITGCRINEALTMTWDNVHEELLIIKDTKTNQTRYLPLPKILKVALDNAPREGRLVFPSKTGNVVDDQYINAELKKRCKYLGITKTVTCHTFRHTFISSLLKNGVPMHIVSRLAGHKKIETTNTYYTHVVADELAEHLYTLPLLRQEMTIESIGKKLSDTVDRLVDRTKFSITLVKDDDGIKFEIKNKD